LIRPPIVRGTVWAWLCALLLAGGVRGAPGPNIVVILADDLGYGDLHCYNKDGKIDTPHLDRMAAEGMRFLDAHSASAVCTPTRYGLLTGRYCWRTRLKKGVLGGWSPHLIDDGRLTVAGLLNRQGYVTACIGKWHLGMDWPARGDGFGDAIEPAKNWREIDFTKPARLGPTDAGFSEFFGIAASLDMPPFAFIRNGRLDGELTATRTYLRTGPATPDFAAENVVSALTKEACAFLRARADDRKRFFLYLALTSPHTPVVPSKEWQGKSAVGPYGDFVMETDHAAGAVLEALRGSGLDRETLVIFTSDNGATPDNANTQTVRRAGHRPNHPWRGAKSDIWEGGHRVPFIARWPGTTPAGSQCPEPVCLNTLMATAAALTNATLPPNAGPDSYSIAPWLRGEKPASPTHPFIIHHSIDGLFAVRRGQWKFIDGPGSGGWSKGATNSAERQLYSLATDPGETHNVINSESAIAAELSALLQQSRAATR
jgi:arylsulfatase A-like enzyme